MKKIFVTLMTFCLIVLPLAASAQSQQPYQFYAYYDGNSNGVIDYDGSDVCLRNSRTLVVGKIGSGIQPIYYITLEDTDFTITTDKKLNKCIVNSSDPISIDAPYSYFTMNLAGVSRNFDSYVNSPPNVNVNEGLKLTFIP